MKALRENLAIASHRAYHRGLQLGNGGNSSARVFGEDLMLVTASGGSFIDCGPESFLLTTFDGEVVEGTGKPTKEWYMHGQIYRLRPDVQSIMHTHSPYTNTIAHFEDKISLITWHSRLKVSAEIPVIPVPSAVVRPQDWPLVQDRIGVEHSVTAFVLRDHGTVALGSNPIEAEHLAELVEETAQIAYMTEVLSRLRSA